MMYEVWSNSSSRQRILAEAQLACQEDHLEGTECPLHIGQSDMSLGVFVAVELPGKVSSGEKHQPQVTRTPEKLKCLIRISRVTFQR